MSTLGHDLYVQQMQWVRDWRSEEPIHSMTSARFDATLWTLQHCNMELWEAEDQARYPQISENKLGQLKRHIDIHNLRRVKAINALDTYLIQDNLPTNFVQPEASLELNTETPGQLLDRLSILALKIYHGEMISSDTGQAAVLRMKAQVEFLCHKYTHLVEALKNNRFLFFPAAQFKLYQGDFHLSA